MAGDAEDPPISYRALERGVEVRTADGTAIGAVDQVLDNVRENIFDGIVVRTAEGRRFVDAPEVERITAAAVTLSIDTEQAAELPPYQPGAPEFQANPRAGRLSRLLRGGWRRR